MTSFDSASLDRATFYEAAMSPEWPDEIAVQIDRPVDDDPAVTFSEEAIDAVAEQFRTFLMARVVARSKVTGSLPKHVRATVVLDWAPGNPREDAGPFYHVDGDEGLTPFDGTKRKWDSW